LRVLEKIRVKEKNLRLTDDRYKKSNCLRPLKRKSCTSESASDLWGI